MYDLPAIQVLYMGDKQQSINYEDPDSGMKYFDFQLL